MIPYFITIFEFHIPFGFAVSLAEGDFILLPFVLSLSKDTRSSALVLTLTLVILFLFMGERPGYVGEP
jgi:hypothetical protein